MLIKSSGCLKKGGAEAWLGSPGDRSNPASGNVLAHSRRCSRLTISHPLKRRGMIDLRSVPALGIVAAIALLTGCGGSQQPMTGAASTAGHQSATPARAESFHGYFRAKFTDDAGYPIPFSSLCLQFTPLGAWHSVPPTAFTGTFLTSDNELFASALAPWSPTAYASLQVRQREARLRLLRHYAT